MADTLKSAPAPFLGEGRVVKFGRLMPERKAIAPLFAHYAVGLPPPPATVNYATTATMESMRNVYGNNALGDCVVAAGYHNVGLWTGNSSDLYIATPQQIVHDYSAIGGYIPGNPATDRGCNEESALNYWLQRGFTNGTKLAGWLRVNATNKTEVKQALWLFESLFFGIAMPDQWLNPMPQRDGFVWDVTGRPDPSNGHAWLACGYSDVGMLINTWGLMGTLTWNAVSQYAIDNAGGELYLMLSPDIINKATGKAPNGFDWAALVNDFNAMGGNLPPPSPVNPPTPTPPPTASGTVTVVLGGITYRGTLTPTTSMEGIAESPDDIRHSISRVLAEFTSGESGPTQF